MDEFKKLVKISMKLLNEADGYADYYKECPDSDMRSLYYSLGSAHLDLYNKVRSQIASYLNKLMRDKPDEHVDIIWNFIKSTEEDLHEKIMNKMK
nr:MAG TPA: hypothetical protein [Caudoviricetes sp.]